MKKYYIYMHQNKINGKKYIGQTCQKPEYRWNNGKGYSQCPHFYAAIQKYGWDNFEHIILETDLTLEEANKKEQEYIALYDTLNKEKGYNLSKGGDNREPLKETREKYKERNKKFWENEENKQRMSKIMKEKWKDPEYLKKQQEYHKNHIHTISEEGRKRISEARKEYIKIHGTPTQGVGHTEETKRKISESVKGEKNPMYGKHHTEEWKQRAREISSVAVYCVEANKIFNSRKEAAKWCGLKSSTGIIDCIAGRKQSSGKHPETGEKLHWKNVDEDIKKNAKGGK